MARTKNPAPHAARSAADAATTPAPAPVAPAAGDSPAAAVLAALSAEPAGAAVAVIAARAGISTAAARQALLAHEKAGTATRVKGSRPGIADTWKPAAAPAAPGDEAPPAEAPGTGSTADPGQPAAEPAGGTADVGQPAPAPAGGTAEDQQAESGAEPGPDPAVTAEAAGSVLAIAQAADAAGKALAAGDLPATLFVLERAREQAAQGRRAVKAAASGRHAPATRPGALRDLVEEHLRKFPGTAFTSHQVGKVLIRSAGAVANALDKLTALGTAQMVTDKPRTYQLAPAAPPPPPPPRTRPTTPAPARDCGQRGVTRGPRGRRGRDGQPMPPWPRRLRVYLPGPKPGWTAVPPGVTPSRRAGRRPLPARYIRALTGVVSRQVHGRDTRGT
jgi:hypothetical protein